MQSIIFRLVAGIMAFGIGVAVTWLATFPLTSNYARNLSSKTLVPVATAQTNEDAARDLPSEISLERIFDGCTDCPDRKIEMKRDGGKKFDATVIETNLHTKKQRRGKISAGFFNRLLKLIEHQDYFNLNNQYAMGWVDSTIVNISVSIGDKRKVIRTRNEGEVPIQLWGIYWAIEGAIVYVKWDSNQ